MSKPDWNNAPEWADYLAQDHDGIWYWYEEKPYPVSRGRWVVATGRCCVASTNLDWVRTLDPRPKPENPGFEEVLDASCLILSFFVGKKGKRNDC